MLPDMVVEGDFLIVGGGFADVFSADLLGFLIPTMHHPLLGELIRQSGISAFDKGQHIYLGLVLLGLLLFNLRMILYKPAVRFWLVAMFVFALLALGPVIFINGWDSGLPGPFVILQQLPFFKGNRYPSRYSVMLMLSLSVLAGFSLVHLGRWLGQAQRTRQYLIIGMVTLFFLFEHLSIPLPQSDMRIPTPYEIIAADPTDFAVLDIPFAWRNGFRITGALTPQFMFGQFYQIHHQKPLLQGNTSRNPEFKFQYFTQAPIINSLLALETGKTLPPERWEVDRAIALPVLDFFNIKYLVVRPYSYGIFNGAETITVTEQAVIPYIEDVFPVEKIYDTAEIKIYQIQDRGTAGAEFQAGYRIDATNSLAPLYFGEGWGLLSQGRPISAQRQRARLLLPLTSEAQQISFRIRLPEIYKQSTQNISLVINGWQSTAQPLKHEWTEVTFAVPKGLAQAGLNDVWLHFSDVATLPQYQANTQPFDVTVLSAGEEVGSYGHIFINGYEVSPNQRGYNVALLTPEGTIETRSFDTHLSRFEGDALTYFILPATVSETFIALAASDEASLNLSEDAVHQIQQTTGATDDLRGCFRCSHAVIRTAEGQTIEALDPLQPVGVTTGLGLTEPAVAAVVEWLRVEVEE